MQNEVMQDDEDLGLARDSRLGRTEFDLVALIL